MDEFVLAPTDREHRLYEMLPRWAIAVDVENVNLNDILGGSQPGTVWRCYGRPQDCIQVHLLPENDTLGCVAGWISEDEQ